MIIYIYIYNNLYLKIEGNIYYINVDYKGLSDTVPMHNILTTYINNAYLTYKINNDMGISAGRFEFMYGSYSEVSELDIEMGIPSIQMLITVLTCFLYPPMGIKDLII